MAAAELPINFVPVSPLEDQVFDSIKLTFADCDASPVELVRENTFLFTFLGENALYDHVFVTCTPDHQPIAGTPTPPEDLDPEAPVAGHYHFCFEDDFQTISNYVRSNNFRQALNLPEPDWGDIEAYARAFANHMLELEKRLASTSGLTDEDLAG
jgi:hypothetical protein